jgi:hypothetical protein
MNQRMAPLDISGSHRTWILLDWHTSIQIEMIIPLLKRILKLRADDIADNTLRLIDIILFISSKQTKGVPDRTACFVPKRSGRTEVVQVRL